MAPMQASVARVALSGSDSNQLFRILVDGAVSSSWRAGICSKAEIALADWNRGFMSESILSFPASEA